MHLVLLGFRKKMIYQLDKCSVGHFLTVCFFFLIRVKSYS